MKTVGKLLLGFIAGFLAGFLSFATILVDSPETTEHVNDLVHGR